MRKELEVQWKGRVKRYLWIPDYTFECPSSMSTTHIMSFCSSEFFLKRSLWAFRLDVHQSISWGWKDILLTSSSQRFFNAIIPFFILPFLVSESTKTTNINTLNSQLHSNYLLLYSPRTHLTPPVSPGNPLHPPNPQGKTRSPSSGKHLYHPQHSHILALNRHSSDRLPHCQQPNDLRLHALRLRRLLGPTRRLDRPKMEIADRSWQRG